MSDRPQGWKVWDWLTDPYGTKALNKQLHEAIRDKQQINQQIARQEGTVKQHQITLKELEWRQKANEIDRVGSLATGAIVNAIDGSWGTDAMMTADVNTEYREKRNMITQKHSDTSTALQTGMDRLGNLQGRSASASRQQQKLEQRLENAQARQEQSMEMMREVMALERRAMLKQNEINYLATSVALVDPTPFHFVEDIRPFRNRLDE
jgi:hypothetical protein